MPLKPKRLCRHTGCQRLANDNGYCDKHKPKVYEKNKAVHNLYDANWRRERITFLAEHPWCEDCLDRNEYEAATEVHHSTPHRGDRVIFWDKSKWRALSKRCHSKRTAKGE